MSDTYSEIISCLEASFPGAKIDLIDNSAAHAGHAEQKRSGGGHYALKIVSESFSDLNRVKRHQAVYGALSNLLSADAIHAIQINALSPDEA